MLKVFWFRKDLRLYDNRSLFEFANSISPSDQFCFLYIKNKNSFNYFGEPRIRFLYECLEELSEGLNNKGFKLQIIEGNSKEVFEKICKNSGSIDVYASEQCEPYCRKRDDEIRDVIEKNNGRFHLFADSTIFDLSEVLKDDGKPYTVYTPFRNKALKILNQKELKKYKINFSKFESSNEFILKKFRSLNYASEKDKFKKSPEFSGGRREAIKKLNRFLKSGIKNYQPDRDFPAVNGTSKLSPYLHFGIIGIREVFRNINVNKNASKWLDELLWREFYYNIGFHFPHIEKESFKRQYDKLNWNKNEKDFQKWCNGRTGYPIVDAGMRQLNNEGWMHNRVRMITAMFLTKDLMIDWRKGEKYFADKLIDMDFANNNGGWQWSASTGCDAQPYFRIFNPVSQSKKFDSDGKYIKKYIPELKNVDAKFIHAPWEMTKEEQAKCGLIIGKDYPKPVVEHLIAREIAIKEYKRVSKNLT
ncbi:MAG TPA: deoxyribodipyrimidine photo-lyase [Ignavibacteria bacterium]|nr:deoxyribodipyrimidine photo-lyase [Ignavibacteria bacterium]